MRLLKVLLTGLFAVFALLAGLFVAVVGVLTFFVRRLRGGSSPVHPPVQVRGHRSRQSADDVIEVTATEVPADPAAR